MAVSIGRYQRPQASYDATAPIGIAVGIGAIAMVAAGVIAAMIPAAYPGWRFGVIAAAVLVFAAASMDQRALGIVALIGALIFNGFLEDRMGQLAWHSDDLWRLMLLVVVGVFGLAAGESYRFVRDLRLRSTNEAESIALFASSTEEVSTTEEEKHGA